MAGNMKVLLVDDEEDLVTTLVERLSFRGIEAEYALEGRKALEMIEAGGYDVVVLDFKLPGESGEEIRHIIRSKHPDIPVLMITGHGAPLDKPESTEPRKDVLEKPIKLELLIERIRELAGKA